MPWDDLTENPLLVSNYELLKKIGILDSIEQLKVEKRGLENLILEDYEIFSKESVEELVDLIIKFLSDKFIPSNLIFILNEGIMVNRIKILAYQNMKIIESGLKIDSLEPYEKFFRNHSGTTGFPIFEKEMTESPYLSSFREYNPEIIVPVLGLSGLYGIILFGPKIVGGEYSPREITDIDRLMKFTSIGIQNTIHYENSVKDAKTGLYNHNFFINRMNEELARAGRNKTSFSVLILDIDKFKHFNDTYGHLAGDEVITGIAETLKRTIREGDILSRFGGEEFTVLLPFAGREEAWNAAERLRKEVESLETNYQGRILKVTISLGIATYNYYENLDEKNLLKRADKALYESKEKGRNRSSFYKSGLLYRAGTLSKGSPVGNTP